MAKRNVPPERGAGNEPRPGEPETALQVHPLDDPAPDADLLAMYDHVRDAIDLAVSSVSPGDSDTVDDARTFLRRAHALWAGVGGADVRSARAKRASRYIKEAVAWLLSLDAVLAQMGGTDAPENSGRSVGAYATEAETKREAERRRIAAEDFRRSRAEAEGRRIAGRERRHDPDGLGRVKPAEWADAILKARRRGRPRKGVVGGSNLPTIVHELLARYELTEATPRSIKRELERQRPRKNK